VLHVTESLGGGVTTALQSYIRLTPEFDHFIIANRQSPFYRQNWLDDEVTFLELPTEGRLAQTRAISRAFRQVLPDVVHAHSSWAGLYVRLLPSISSSRIVYTPHCFAFERTDVGPLARLVFRVAEFALGIRTEYVLGNGPREVKLAKGLRTVRNVASVLVTPWQSDGMGRDRRSVLRDPEPQRPLIIATTGRAVQQKGVDFFLAIVASWPLLVPEGVTTVEWHWLGGGEPAAERRLRQAGVHVSGWLPQDIVVHRLRGAAIYVHTAEWEAGYPLALMEAAALGLPLVIRSIPALEDLPLPLAHTPWEAAEQVCALLDEKTRVAASEETRKWAQRLQESSGRARLAGIYRAVASGSLKDD
jgi:glycosyltransferase involved in cell wall biosynthesis